jgi:hypothetical protein
MVKQIFMKSDTLELSPITADTFKFWLKSVNNKGHLHEDQHAFLRVEVTGQGLCTLL